MIKSKTFIKIGTLFIGLCLLLVFSSYKQKSTHDKEMAAQTTILFLNSLSKGDSKSALKYVWPDERLYEELKIPERFLPFKDSKILEITRGDYDSAKGRPEYYQEFYKIISLMIKLKVVHTDDAENPPGDYVLFINIVQKDPRSNWFITELGGGP
ncbi:hypothetical protein AY606_15440 [Acinetobacter sp. SFB]|uniref:hypothetical protein n=1 Tax=Acinetobacter sp. SFB TaxID=1805634 RepID=UPI0007D7B402|nr:hypothetical protein [Acinetobacter sp. SFB]OAL80411.1 hypothetical protein AY606_15440 [Acinetobacter sp. SFB]